MSLIRNLPRQSAGAGSASATSATPALEDPTAIMESLITGIGFDIAMVQNGLLPPQETPPEEPPFASPDLPVEPAPIELAAFIDASALALNPTDPMWWLLGHA